MVHSDSEKNAQIIEEIENKPFVLPDYTYRPFPCIIQGVFTGLFGIPLAYAFQLLMIPPVYSDQIDRTQSYLRQNIEVAKKSFGEYRRCAWRSAKSFFWFGILFSSTDCLISRHRGSYDICNSLASGVLSSYILTYRSGWGSTIVQCLFLTSFIGIIEGVFLGHFGHRPVSILSNGTYPQDSNPLYNDRERLKELLNENAHIPKIEINKE